MSGDYVILLHGLGRTLRSMKKMARYLSARGFVVINHDYPSRKGNIRDLAGGLAALIEERCPHQEKKIHFVTHSLGGIIVRLYLKENRLGRLGRVVMLAPPNKGTPLADRLSRYSFVPIILGPAVGELTTDPGSPVIRLGEVDYELGVIAGDRSQNPLFSRQMSGPDDGKVPVDRTMVEGMRDFLQVPCGHTFIMNDREVQRQVAFFLEEGRFDRPPD